MGEEPSKRRRPIGQAASILSDVSETEIGIDDVHVVGYGENYRVFGATLQLDAQRRRVVVRLPRSTVAQQQARRLRKAVAIQRRLAGLNLDFEIPRPLALYSSAQGPAVIESRISGTELPEHIGNDGVDPVNVTAAVAAECHGIGLQKFEDLMEFDEPGLDADIELVSRSGLAGAREARRFLQRHRPPERRCLLHGDLLAQNIIVERPTDGDSRSGLGVVDWEGCCIGDPARELARITGGYDTVYATGQSREELLEAYDRTSEFSVDSTSLRAYELIAIARASVDGDGDRRERLQRRFSQVLERLT